MYCYSRPQHFSIPLDVINIEKILMYYMKKQGYFAALICISLAISEN